MVGLCGQQERRSQVMSRIAAPCSRAVRAVSSSCSLRLSQEMSSSASRSVRVAAKALAFAATALVMQRLPRPLSLSEASMATGRLLSVASISMISALRSTLMAFRNWRRLSA